VLSEDITSGSATTWTITLAQAMPEASSQADASTHSSWNINTLLAFATSTVFTTSARGLEHGADVVHDGSAYDR